MNKTLRISFVLRNTYYVNSILYALKQIPLIKKLLPEKIYGVWGFKVFANVLSVLWEILSAFLGKFAYIALMIVMVTGFYAPKDESALFLHIFVLLTVIGAFMNTYMFNPTKDKYYAIVLMRMDAKAYTIVNYAYAILKVLAGFGVFGILFGKACGLPLWQCIMLPFFVAGMKSAEAARCLADYEKRGAVTNENKLGNFSWVMVCILLAAAYGLPALGICLPKAFCTGFMGICILAGVLAWRKILHFSAYREMYQLILSPSEFIENVSKQAVAETQKQSHAMISADTGIQSKKSGLEYMNELFIKRHQKLLWKSAMRITLASVAIIGILLAAFSIKPEIAEMIHGFLLSELPCFVFVMYAINKGAGFTRALFINCDHSLLTYAFYKQPKAILKLFWIRLREIVKINLLPAAVIGAGMMLLLYFSGGTTNLWDYAVIFVTIAGLSIFFSVHYLTLYYLLQPFNAGTEVKSGTYQIITSATYIVSYCLIQFEVPTFVFGLATIGFCILYAVIASLLVYRFAPKTFRIRT